MKTVDSRELARSRPADQNVEIRVYGDESQPTLIYLPGLHGDWTLIGGFRKELAGEVRFVEATYPRTVDWSLEDYAAGVEAALANHGICRGWLLGESFSSQVVWALLARRVLEIQAVILAGGFVSHPWPWVVRFAENVCARTPLWLIHCGVWGYGKLARWRFRQDPETIAGIEEFVTRRTEPDRQAGVHRLRLLSANDIRPIARRASVPVYALTGAADPIVPWPWVRWWLRRNCPALHQYKVLWRADHNVLASAPRAAARAILGWISGSKGPSSSVRASPGSRWVTRRRTGFAPEP
jgi:pimeloyl-ACP methyl ester carboxylesterase